MKAGGNKIIPPSTTPVCRITSQQPKSAQQVLTKELLAKEMGKNPAAAGLCQVWNNYRLDSISKMYVSALWKEMHSAESRLKNDATLMSYYFITVARLAHEASKVSRNGSLLDTYEMLKEISRAPMTVNRSTSQISLRTFLMHLRAE